MKIAVTGGTGQIGTGLVKELIKQGHEVTALILDGKKLGLEGLPIKFVEGNVLNRADCDKLCTGADVVFHLAAIVSINGDPNGHVWNVNVNGTHHMLDACVKQGIKKLVHFSSIHAYSTQPVEQPLDENRTLADENAFAYERSKAAGQKLVLEYVKKHGLNASVINPTGVLGYDDHLPSIKGKMLIDFCNGNIPMLTPGGFDWVDSRDVVKAAINAMHRGGAGECYLVSGKYYTLTEFANVIGKVTRKKMPKLIAPVWMMRMFLPFVQLYSKIANAEPLYTIESLKSLLEGNRQIDYSKAAIQLGHAPRPLEETIADSYAWFKQRGMVR